MDNQKYMGHPQQPGSHVDQHQHQHQHQHHHHEAQRERQHQHQHQHAEHSQDQQSHHPHQRDDHLTVTPERSGLGTPVDGDRDGLGPALPPKSPRMTKGQLQKHKAGQGARDVQAVPDQSNVKLEHGSRGDGREHGHGQGGTGGHGGVVGVGAANGTGTDTDTGTGPRIVDDGYPPRPHVNQSGNPSPNKTRFGQTQHQPSGSPRHDHDNDQHPQQHHQNDRNNQDNHHRKAHHNPNTGRASPPPNIQIHPPAHHQHHPSHSAPGSGSASRGIESPSTAPLPAAKNMSRGPTSNLSGGAGAKSPLLERLKQTFISREPMSRTWARKSYQEELDSVSQVGDGGGVGHIGVGVEGDRGGGGVGGVRGIENQNRGRGMRSAPASISDRGDVESQTHQTGSVFRPVSIYASPAAVAQFRALPPVGPDGNLIPSHSAMRI